LDSFKAVVLKVNTIFFTSEKKSKMTRKAPGQDGGEHIGKNVRPYPFSYRDKAVKEQYVFVT